MRSDERTTLLWWREARKMVCHVKRRLARTQKEEEEKEQESREVEKM
jgi:hypothetical protein